MELTDLEINKAIAKILGVEVALHPDSNILCEVVINPRDPFNNKRYGKEFNAVNNGNLICDLIEKHDLDVTAPYRPNGETQYEVGFFLNDYSDADCVYDEDFKRAVCLAVIKKSELL